MWTEKHSKKFVTPNYSKEFFRKLVVLKFLGNVKNKDILELGCGSGYWTRILSKKGARCVGIDKSKEQLNIAKKEELENPLGIKYSLGDVTRLRKIKSNNFDIVFSEFVFLEIPNLKKLNKIFTEAYRVLKKGGIFFISDMHPFDPIVHNRFEFPKKFDYFQKGAKMIAKAKQLDGSWIRFTDYHWMFEDYFSALIKAKFVLLDFKEPQVSKKLIKKVPYLKYREFLPKDMVIVAKK